jgi:hypothetical protein
MRNHMEAVARRGLEGGKREKGKGCRSKLTMADDGGLEGDHRAAAREGGRDLRRHRNAR